MGDASLVINIEADAASIWDLVGDFNGMPRWHPGVAESVLEDGGRIRRLRLAHGAVVVERLMQHDADKRICTYSMAEGPLPIRAHSATIHVAGSGSRSTVSWVCEFESAGPPDAEIAPIFRQIFEAGLTNLKALLEKR